MLQTYKNSSIDWMPSPIVALATSVDDSQVAAAREDYTLEIWLVSPGAVGWHRQLTINGDPNSRVSSLVWCHAGSGGMPCGRLFSSSIDGLILEWDLFELKQKIVLDSIGVSIWQMAVAPFDNYKLHREFNQLENGSLRDNDSDHHQDSSESEDDSDVTEYHKHSVSVNPCVAIACDDGRVQIYSIPDADKFNFIRSLPRVSGRVLSIAWSPDADMIYSGSSDGLIRCWNTKLGHEVYRITVGLGGLGSGPELCVWSLLSLRCGTLVSADSTGSVHFWDSQRGTLLQTHTVHKGDVNALAAAPSHNRVYSAGSDGQVILYKLSGETVESSDSVPISIVMKKWIYVGYVRAHTHDIRALTVAVPISREGTSDKEEIEWQMKNKKKEKRGGDQFPNEEKKENGDELSHDRRRGRRDRSKRKPTDDFSYPKWAQMGVPMLISGGDDTKLFAYSIKEFTKFSPHDICPAPQRVPMQLVTNTDFNRTPLLLVQASHWLDIFCVRPKSNSFSNMACAPSESVANANLLARVTSKASRKIICSAISNCGKLFAYSDHVKPNLFELRIPRTQTHAWSVNKRQLPHGLPFAHCMIFSFDSSRLLIAGCDKRIYVVDMDSLELIHAFTPCRDVRDEKLLPSEPPITKMFTSSDGQWLAAVNCFGDVYIFNLEVLRQHWFISRLNGASVTAGGFPQWNNNVLVVTTSLNQIYAFDVEAKQLGAWSKRNSHVLPKKYQEFPGEVVGLSFPSSTGPSTVIVYSSRAMCSIDFRMSVEDDGVDRDDENSQDDTKKNIIAIINTAMDALEKQQGLKRKKKPDYLQQESKLEYHQPRKKPCNTTNFEISSFRDPVLFIGHLSENSLLKIDKPWLDVVKTLDSAPVHRHSYGT